MLNFNPFFRFLCREVFEGPRWQTTRLLWCGHEGAVDHSRQSAERRADTYGRSVFVPTAI